MELNINHSDKGVRAEVCGRIDTASSPAFELALQPIFDDASQAIELDCTQLSYISSSGLRIFLALLKRVQACKGSLKITHLSPEIQEVFRMTGFSKLFNIEA